MLKEMDVESVLLKEMELVSQKINHFDTLRHNTKQISITLWLASVGVGPSLDNLILLFLSALIPLPFWYFDATYHSYQEGFNARLRAIQNYIRGEDYPLGENESFPIPDFYGVVTLPKSQHRKLTSLRNNAFKKRSVVFYGVLIVGTVTIALTSAVSSGQNALLPKGEKVLISCDKELNSCKVLVRE